MNAHPTSDHFIAKLASGEPSHLIQLSSVGKQFQVRGRNAAVQALDAINLSIHTGEIFGIIGRSGAGKSTLIRIINGLEKADHGSVLIAGEDITRYSERDLLPIRRKIGMIFQHFNLLSSRTVFDNIALPLEIAGFSNKVIRERILPLLNLVGLEDKAGRYPAELSGGQKQRVGIARALATEPNILLCDEATSALDPETTESILHLLQDVNQKLGLTIVLITHEIPVIQSICHRVAVLEAGRIVEQGKVLDVFLRPQHDITQTLVRQSTGLELPKGYAERLLAAPQVLGQAIVKIVFSGENATAPILSRLTTTLGVDVNLLAGRIGEIGGEPYGALLVAVPSEPLKLAAAVAALNAVKQHAEVIGYVA